MDTKHDDWRKSIKEMSKSIVAMEETFDSSMRGVLLDTLVTNYVEERGKAFCDMFEYLMKNQEKNRASYGDSDVAVTKIKITVVEQTKYHKNEATGLVVYDIFCDNIFVIVKLVSTHKEEGLSDIFDTRYFVRKIAKECKTFSLKKAMGYDNSENNSPVVEFRIGFLRKELTIFHGRGMSRTYAKFEDAYRALKSAYHELTNAKQ